MSLKLCLSTVFLLLLFFPMVVLSSSEREFDREILEAFRYNSEFDYSQGYAPSDSWITLVLTHLLSTFSNIFDSLNVQWALPLLFRVFLIGGIIVAVWLILRLKYGKVLSKKSPQFGDFPIMNFEQQEEDYQKLLRESLANNQHRLAARYLFLSTLLLLEQQKCLTITKWKVPHDYLRELPEEKKADFKRLTVLFEKTWYGEYQPDKEELDQGLQLYRGLQNA